MMQVMKQRPSKRKAFICHYTAKENKDSHPSWCGSDVCPFSVPSAESGGRKGLRGISHMALSVTLPRAICTLNVSFSEVIWLLTYAVPLLPHTVSHPPWVSVSRSGLRNPCGRNVPGSILQNCPVGREHISTYKPRCAVGAVFVKPRVHASGMPVQVTSEVRCFQLVQCLEATRCREPCLEERIQDRASRAALGTTPYEEYLKEIQDVQPGATCKYWT